MCGWTSEQQEQCSYSSHIKPFYGASKRGVWSIGSDVIVKERPDEAPRVLRDWVDSNKRYFVLQERSLLPRLLFSDGKPHGSFYPDLELWDPINLTLHGPPKRNFSRQVLESLKKRLPRYEPYVLTHCNLDLGNIMVKDGNLVGLLQERFGVYGDAYKDAKDFWMDLCHLRKYPDLDKTGRETQERSSSDLISK
ncbi:hypothetical protein BJX76DRAFT_352471 [Aspergillus varians]